MKQVVDTFDAVSERLAQGSGLGRAVDLARELGVTSNQVWTWKSRQAVNGFPDPVACTWSPWREGRWTGKDLYDIEAVRVWFKEYDPRANQARGGGRNANGRRGKNG